MSIREDLLWIEELLFWINLIFAELRKEAPPRLSKKIFRQPADESQLKQAFIGNVIFLGAKGSRAENDIGSSLTAAPRAVHAAAANYI